MAVHEPDPELLYMMEAASFSCTHVIKDSKVVVAFSTFDTGNSLISDIGFIYFVHYLGKKGKYLKPCKYILEYVCWETGRFKASWVHLGA